MLSEKMISLMNEQINKEFYSAYLYFSFANFYEAKGLMGFASWFKNQAKEEQAHGMMFYQFLQDNDSSVSFKEISAPNPKFENLEEPLVASLNHEKYVTASINKIYAQAIEEKDYRSVEFLTWFIKEQTEEETLAMSLLDKIKIAGGEKINNESLYSLDRDLEKTPDDAVLAQDVTTENP
jgi:ferritin